MVGETNLKYVMKHYPDEDRTTVENVTKAINKFCVGLDYIWCPRSLFDFTILQNFYKMAGKSNRGTTGKLEIVEHYLK